MATATRHVISVCGSCEGAGAAIAAALGDAPGVEVRLVDCMNVCSRPVTVAARAEGKEAYLFGDVTEAEVPGLVAFAALWSAAADGMIADARPLGPLRLKLIGRLPG